MSAGTIRLLSRGRARSPRILPSPVLTVMTLQARSSTLRPGEHSARSLSCRTPQTSCPAFPISLSTLWRPSHGRLLPTCREGSLRSLSPWGRHVLGSAKLTPRSSRRPSRALCPRSRESPSAQGPGVPSMLAALASFLSGASMAQVPDRGPRHGHLLPDLRLTHLRPPRHRLPCSFRPSRRRGLHALLPGFWHLSVGLPRRCRASSTPYGPLSCLSLSTPVSPTSLCIRQPGAIRRLEAARLLLTGFPPFPAKSRRRISAGFEGSEASGL